MFHCISCIFWFLQNFASTSSWHQVATKAYQLSRNTYDVDPIIFKLGTVQVMCSSRSIFLIHKYIYIHIWNFKSQRALNSLLLSVWKHCLRHRAKDTNTDSVFSLLIGKVWSYVGGLPSWPTKPFIGRKQFPVSRQSQTFITITQTIVKPQDFFCF